MQIISSKDNDLIKKIRSLKDKKFRDMYNEFIVEGIKMIKEAIDEKAKISSIVICEECINDGTIDKNLLYEIAKFNCIYVTKKVFLSLTDVTNPQGILAVIEKNSLDNEIKYDEEIILVLDGLQDPGNLGTILRTADSANLKQIVISKDTADCYNPKVVRSTMGAIFRINVIETDNLVEKIKVIKKHKFEILATSLDTNDSIYDVEYTKKAIVIGNEANGVSKEVQNIADRKIKIPMPGKTESLNASVATGIIIYEYIRQNSNK